MVRLRYVHGSTETVDFAFFYYLEDGINTSLLDWWLADTDFILRYEEFSEQRDEAEDSMNEEMIECWETWHNDGRVKNLSAAEEISYHEAVCYTRL